MRGEYDVAIAHLAHSMRLSPLDPEMYRIQGGTALAHLCAGRYDAATAWAERAIRGLPSFLIVVCILAAGHALAGRADAAQHAMQTARRLDPALRASRIKDWLLFHRPENIAGPDRGAAEGRTAGLMHRRVHDLLLGCLVGGEFLDDAALAADQDAVGEIHDLRQIG